MAGTYKGLSLINDLFDGGTGGAKAVITQKQKNDAYQLGQAGYDKDYVQKTVGVHEDIEAARQEGWSEIRMDKTKRTNKHKAPYK